MKYCCFEVLQRIEAAAGGQVGDPVPVADLTDCIDDLVDLGFLSAHVELNEAAVDELRKLRREDAMTTTRTYIPNDGIPGMRIDRARQLASLTHREAMRELCAGSAGDERPAWPTVTRLVRIVVSAARAVVELDDARAGLLKEWKEVSRCSTPDELRSMRQKVLAREKAWKDATGCTSPEKAEAYLEGLRAWRPHGTVESFLEEWKDMMRKYGR